jgi:hypothetical protein
LAHLQVRLNRVAEMKRPGIAGPFIFSITATYSTSSSG